jgi:hypothetical protein
MTALWDVARSVVSLKYTDVSEVRTASIIRAIIALMIVYFIETTRRYIPECCHLYIRRRENLKSHEN